MSDNKDPVVLVAVPGLHVHAATMQCMLRTCSEAANHRIHPRSYMNGNGWLNFNQAWAQGLNEGRHGGIDYFVMLHGDADPTPGWLNGAVGYMRSNPELGLISMPMSIKDERGLLSYGAGDTANPWWPFRRVTNYENQRLPGLASLVDLFHLWKIKPQNGTFLIHNNACWIADVRKKEWHNKVKNRSGVDCKPCFNFPMQIEEFVDAEGRTLDRPVGNPEDFEFSRMAHEAGIQSRVWTSCETHHWQGSTFFNSHKVYRPGEPGGMLKFDHDVGSDAAHTDEERYSILQESRWYAGFDAPPTDADGRLPTMCSECGARSTVIQPGSACSLRKDGKLCRGTFRPEALSVEVGG